MLDYAALWECLEELGLGSWQAELQPVIEDRMSERSHGDFPKWRDALEQLERTTDAGRRRELLLSLSPWRKGPFTIGGITIDSEWRSNLKWDRLEDAIAPLAGRKVLDVGSGNGYYALRMREAGADVVIGIDPTLLYVLQFLAVQQFQKVPRVFVLPLRLHELPGNSRAFDTTFSMGVLYHQRSPIDHLHQLRRTLGPDGELVLETLFLPGEEHHSRTPGDRYARMRNVWLLPTIAELTTWLERSGFDDIDIVNRSRTSLDEHSRTS